jgi:hypothetical protein
VTTLPRILALALALLSPAAAQEQLEHGAHLAPGSASFDATIPDELAVERAPTGHLLVRPRINGQDAGWFIFDTGAGICVVSTGQEQKLGLKLAGEVEATGIGGSASTGVQRAELVSLGPLTLRDHPFMVTDLSFLTPYLGHEISGVLGFGVLSACVAEVRVGDGALAPRIALHDPAHFKLEGTAWSALDLSARIPAVQARFEDRSGLFQVDTGANGWVTFNQPAVETWKLLEGRELHDARLGGVGGFVAAKAGQVAWFELGGLRQENVAATFATEKKGNFAKQELAGSIGSDMLRPFTLVLDYAQSRIAFVRNLPPGG